MDGRAERRGFSYSCRSETLISSILAFFFELGKIAMRGKISLAVILNSVWQFQTSIKETIFCSLANLGRLNLVALLAFCMLTIKVIS